MSVVFSDSDQSRIVAPSQIIGSREAAGILGVTVATVTRRVKAGTLAPLAQLDGRRGAFVFDRNDVDAEAAK